MKLWVRIALIAALGILLWILVIDLAENFQDSGALDPTARATRIA